MNIGIVIDKLYPGKIGGAEQYIRNIIDVFNRKENVKMVLFVNQFAMVSFEEMEKVCVPDQLCDAEKYYEYYIAKYDIQVLFCPLFYVPYEHCSIPIVTSILDIQYEFYPEYFTPELLQYRREETRKAIEVSSAIITISEFSKNTIVEKLRVNRKKIFVTHLNSDGSFDGEIDKERNLEMRERLPEHYLFYPANGWPHKNHKKLIDAYKILKEKYGIKSKLLLTGNAFNDENGLQDYILEKGLEHDVISLGYIEQAEMPYVFYNADILVFPSQFEGFGIPLVEAMRVGTPIVCSDCGSIPEIAGDAALFFDADDINDIADKIHVLEQNTDLQEKLIKKGFQRAKDFSWEKCAEQTLNVLNKQAVKHGRIWKTKYKFSKLTLLVPVLKQTDGLKELLDSIEYQEYASKEIIIFSDDKDIVNSISNLQKQYSVKIDVIEMRKLSRFLARNIWRSENGIIGIVQCGQVFANQQILENIIVDFSQNPSDVLWIKPKRDDFWGLQLQNSFESKKYQKFIQFDQASCCVLFVRNRERENLKKIKSWFYGHYQEKIFGYLTKRHISYKFINSEAILDVSTLSDGKGVKYRKSLINLWKANEYIPLSIIDKTDVEQLQLIKSVSNTNADIKNYYSQIENHGVEFDQIALDGWMSRSCELEVDLHEKDGLLVITGENNILQEEAVLEVVIDKEKILCNNVVDTGEFRIELSLPEQVEAGRHLLRLEMKKTFSYYDETQSDIRALSVRLTKILINETIIWTRENG